MSKVPQKLRKFDTGGGALLLSTSSRLVKVAAMPLRKFTQAFQSLLTGVLLLFAHEAWGQPELRPVSDASTVIICKNPYEIQNSGMQLHQQ